MVRTSLLCFVPLVLADLQHPLQSILIDCDSASIDDQLPHGFINRQHCILLCRWRCRNIQSISELKQCLMEVGGEVCRYEYKELRQYKGQICQTENHDMLAEIPLASQFVSGEDDKLAGATNAVLYWSGDVDYEADLPCFNSTDSAYYTTAGLTESSWPLTAQCPTYPGPDFAAARAIRTPTWLNATEGWGAIDVSDRITMDLIRLRKVDLSFHVGHADCEFQSLSTILGVWIGGQILDPNEPELKEEHPTSYPDQTGILLGTNGHIVTRKSTLKATHDEDNHKSDGVADHYKSDGVKSTEDTSPGIVLNSTVGELPLCQERTTLPATMPDDVQQPLATGAAF